MATLYMIASPIGNLEDITLRALRILGELETLFCEDTRVSSKILQHFELGSKRLLSCNKENEAKRVREIIEILDSGQNTAFVSDAGTPLISDPGSLLVAAVAASEHKIEALPGASALTTALSVCPFAINRFCFEGFLPHGPKQRRRVLRQLNEEMEIVARPLVFFESPHRILKSLADMELIFGAETEVFVARELTKKFEQHYHGSIEKVIEDLQEQFPDKVQGELVVILNSLSKDV